MCGLIAAINVSKDKNKKPVNQHMIDMYENQYRRGTEGYGIIHLNKDLKVNLLRATEPTKFMYDLYNNKSAMMFAHHRHPTSTPNKLEQTHPIFVSNEWMKYDYYVSHNGIITNCDELKKEHEGRGIQYTTEIKTPTEEKKTTEYGYCTTTYFGRNKFNDSESIAVEMALFLEGLKENVAFKGGAAFTIVQVDKKTKKAVAFHWGRHNNPLNFQRLNGIIQIASEGPGKAIDEDTIYTIRLGVKKIKITQQELTFPEIIIAPKVETVTATPTTTPAAGTRSPYAGTYEIPPRTATDPRPIPAGTQPATSVVTMTTEDEKEVEAEIDIPENLEQAMDDLRNDAVNILEEFETELQDEGLAFHSNIEEYLTEMKKVMKKMKGLCINLYRNLQESESKQESDLQAVSGGLTKKICEDKGYTVEDLEGFGYSDREISELGVTKRESRVDALDKSIEQAALPYSGSRSYSQDDIDDDYTGYNGYHRNEKDF